MLSIFCFLFNLVWVKTLVQPKTLLMLVSSLRIQVASVENLESERLGFAGAPAQY
jgi:hypothetical protein